MKPEEVGTVTVATATDMTDVVVAVVLSYTCHVTRVSKGEEGVCSGEEAKSFGKAT